MVQTEVRRTEQDERKARSTALGKQGAWMKWDIPERELTFTELWRKDQFRILFPLTSVYDTLPSPENLHQWGLVEDPICNLCGKRGTVEHVISGCKIALVLGRYSCDMAESFVS